MHRPTVDHRREKHDPILPTNIIPPNPTPRIGHIPQHPPLLLTEAFTPGTPHTLQPARDLPLPPRLTFLPALHRTLQALRRTCIEPVVNPPPVQIRRRLRRLKVIKHRAVIPGIVVKASQVSTVRQVTVTLEGILNTYSNVALTGAMILRYDEYDMYALREGERANVA